MDSGISQSAGEKHKKTMSVMVVSSKDVQRTLLTSALTKREWEVLAYLSEGQEYQTIADTLGIGINGVRAHIKSIYRKLNVSNGIQAARFYWIYTYKQKRSRSPMYV